MEQVLTPRQLDQVLGIERVHADAAVVICSFEASYERLGDVGVSPWTLLHQLQLASSNEKLDELLEPLGVVLSHLVQVHFSFLIEESFVHVLF